MLDEVQIDQFLSTKLGFKDWKIKLSGDKLSFLQELIRLHKCNIYYENVTWVAKEPEELETPTVTEVIEHTLGTAGGACVHLNYFMKLLLEKLDFDVFVSAAEVAIVNVPRNHMITIVRLPSAGHQNNRPEKMQTETDTEYLSKVEESSELYLIDVGIGRPIIEPICLTKSKLPYKGRAGGFDFEFRFNSETNLYERYLKGGCTMKGKFENETDEKVDYFFDVKPLQFSDFDEGYRTIFTQPKETFFLCTLVLFRFISLKTNNGTTTGMMNNDENNNEETELEFKSKNLAEPEFQYVCIRGRSISFGTVDSREETKFDTYSEMLPVIEEWFPLLNQETVRRAIFNIEQMRL